MAITNEPLQEELRNYEYVRKQITDIHTNSELTYINRYINNYNHEDIGTYQFSIICIFGPTDFLKFMIAKCVCIMVLTLLHIFMFNYF